MSTALTIAPEDRLPDFFPRVVKQCEKPANSFFQCLNEKAVKQSDNDDAAGSRGLKLCLQLKKDYEKCMIKNEGKKEPKRHRVS